MGLFFQAISQREEMENHKESDAKFPKTAKDGSGGAPRVRRVSSPWDKTRKQAASLLAAHKAAAVKNLEVLAVLPWGLRSHQKLLPVPGSHPPAQKSDTSKLPPETGCP